MVGSVIIPNNDDIKLWNIDIMLICFFSSYGQNRLSLHLHTFVFWGEMYLPEKGQNTNKTIDLIVLLNQIFINIIRMWICDFCLATIIT